MDNIDTPPQEIRQAFNCVGGRFIRLSGGHLNRTYKVESEQEPWVLQRVNPIFDPAIHQNIEVITKCLADRRLVTPTLIKTTTGELFCRDGDGNVWRGSLFIDGKTILAADNPRQCETAGQLVGQFHCAVADYSEPLAGPVRHVHDIDKYIETLKTSQAVHTDHVAAPQVAVVADSLMGLLEGLPQSETLPRRISHGDLKIANILFSENDEAIALIDWDTVARMPWPVELGDAFRSWCATTDEDDPNIEFDIHFFEAAIRGYSSAMPTVWTERERDHIVQWLARICIELGIRFAADALNESYFGFDQERFEWAWQHNLIRAQSQLNLAVSVIAQFDTAAEIVCESMAIAI